MADTASKNFDENLYRQSVFPGAGRFAYLARLGQLKLDLLEGDRSTL